MPRFTLRQHLLSFVIAAAEAIAPQAHAAKDKVQIVPVSDLPYWSGDATTLKWLNARAFRVSVDGPAPDARLGVQNYPAVLHPHTLAMAVKPGRPAPLVGGWEVEAVKPKTCFTSSLVLRHRPSGREATWSVRKHRASNMLDAALHCAETPATTEHAVALNSRHVAFLTSDGGWVFFDRATATFLPLVVLVEANQPSNLYVTPEGRVLVEIDPSYNPATGGAERRTDGIREIIFNGEPLEAPIAASEAAQVSASNEVARCWILHDNGRTCDPQ